MPPLDRRGEDMRRVMVFGMDRAPFEADDRDGFCPSDFLHQNLAAAIGGGRGSRRLLTAERLKAPGADLDDFGMFDRAGAGHDQSSRRTGTDGADSRR